MTSAILTEADVAQLVTDLVGAGTRVIAPVPTGVDGETEYRVVERLEEADLDGALPRRSLKEFLRPALQDERGAIAPQVVLGARPCDAAGAEALDGLMAQEYRDELWRARRAATTIVTVACRNPQESCFCSAVGRGPDSTRGADAILVPLDAPSGASARESRIAEKLRRCVDMFLLDSQPFPGAAELQYEEPPREPMRWAARPVTLRGAVLLRGRGIPLIDPADQTRAASYARNARELVAKNLEVHRLHRRAEPVDLAAEARLGLLAADGGQLIGEASATASSPVARLPEWLARNQEHALWSTLGGRCRGCGHGSAVCSTSPCFDVEDERAPGRGAARAKARVWAGAPRPAHPEHFRQRLMHKFSIHPRRFDEVLCTGCGRCTRSCEGGMNLPEILGGLVQLARPDAPRITT